MRGDIIAYADDLVITAHAMSMIQKILGELERLEMTFGLKINKQKSVFLSNMREYDHVDDISGIKKVEKVKYLGVSISNDRKDMIKEAKLSIRRNVTVIR
jgi:hypothetical protein